MYGIRLNTMEDGSAHPYLAQIPLTVSPFVSLPTATTLPYTYKSIPSTLPPSATGDTADPKPKFVVSPSGHAAHPDDILASCKALTAHLHSTQAAAEARVAEWHDAIRARALAEKRRVAPGWLDRDEKILQPKRKGAETNVMDMQEEAAAGPAHTPGLVEQRDAEGEAMDKAFGGLSMK